MSLEKNIAANNCPLCGQNNFCGNLLPTTDVSESHKGEPCWCTDSSITFSEGLLNQVPDAAKNKACICKACVLRYNLDDSEPA